MLKPKAVTVLTLSTLAFTVCFAVWMLNGVLVTLLEATGIWTTCWIFSVLTFTCLWWLNAVIRKMQIEAAPHLQYKVEEAG